MGAGEVRPVDGDTVSVVRRRARVAYPHGRDAPRRAGRAIRRATSDPLRCLQRRGVCGRQDAALRTAAIPYDATGVFMLFPKGARWRGSRAFGRRRPGRRGQRFAGVPVRRTRSGGRRRKRGVLRRRGDVQSQRAPVWCAASSGPQPAAQKECLGADGCRGARPYTIPLAILATRSRSTSPTSSDCRLVSVLPNR